MRLLGFAMALAWLPMFSEASNGPKWVAASLLILLLVFLLLYGVLRHGLGTFDRRLLPLIVVMLGLVAVMPNMLLGIWGLDFRYPFIALLLAIVAVSARTESVETGAAFWHMVDLVWVLIFPVIYLVR